MRLRLSIDPTVPIAIVYDDEQEPHMTVIMRSDDGSVASFSFTQEEFANFAQAVSKAHGRIVAAERRGGVAEMIEHQRVKGDKKRKWETLRSRQELQEAGP